MRNLNQLNEYRITLAWYPTSGDDKGGCFQFLRPSGILRVVASNGDGWDHVSASYDDHTPSWDDMEFVKRKFFKKDEVAYQFHVAEKDHINFHPHCLHIWRPHRGKILLPPGEMI